jgi:hypothetical protein
MRDPKRMRKILGEIYRIWKKYPDMRYGQLMFNLYYIFDTRSYDHYHVEDSDFLEWLEKFEGF